MFHEKCMRAVVLEVTGRYTWRTKTAGASRLGTKETKNIEDNKRR
jgi:hypothetical protein